MLARVLLGNAVVAVRSEEAVADVATRRKQFSVVLERTVRELHGVRTLDLEDVGAPRQQIISSRSFGHAVYALEDMVEAVSAQATRVAERARKDQSLAGAVHVFVHTSPHRKEDKQFNASTTVPLVRPTADTRLLASTALMGLRAIYRTVFATRSPASCLSSCSRTRFATASWISSPMALRWSTHRRAIARS